MRHIGVTGTAKGVSEKALSTLRMIFHELGKCTLHHGDCIGADATAASVAASLAWVVELHPPDNDAKRAFCFGDVTHPVRPYLDRNHDIVDASELLVAMPRGFKEELRSGTWATVRYARKSGKPVKIIWPDGVVSDDLP